MPTDLFELCGKGENSDSDSSPQIKIDEEFARRLEHNKRREARHRYEELKKQGHISSSDDGECDSNDDDDDDSDNDVRDRRQVLQFVKNLTHIKNSDPEILKKDWKFYSSSEESGGEEEKPKTLKKAAPVYLKDVMAKHLIEEGAEFGAQYEAEQNSGVRYVKNAYNSEQKANVDEFLEAAKATFAAEEEAEELLKVKPRTSEDASDEECAREIEKYCSKLFGNEDDKLDENEKYLKDYVTKQLWAEKGEKTGISADDDIGLSEDEEAVEKQESHEAAYNFRHEEAPATDRVMGYSRLVEGSVRKVEKARKQQRKNKEERAALAKAELDDEVKHLKKLKRKEIEERLKRIMMTGGIGADGEGRIKVQDLEEDFDPEKHDKMMAIYGDEYYNAEDANLDFATDEDSELKKPVFGDEDELLGFLDDGDAGASGKGFAAVRERLLKAARDGEENENKKRKRVEEELNKGLEEIYKLDYEDTIGDLKTRFKYKSVPKQTYGLTSDEILRAADSDLNQYVSLKRLAPYREQEWKVTYHQKLKKNMILRGEKDEKRANKSPVQAASSSADAVTSDVQEVKLSRKARRKQRHSELKLPLSRMMAYGKIPSRPKKKP